MLVLAVVLSFGSIALMGLRGPAFIWVAVGLLIFSGVAWLVLLRVGAVKPPRRRKPYNPRHTAGAHPTPRDN
jgi:hypothetical protein